MAVFGRKRANFEFWQKNENRHILSFLDVQLHAKNQKKKMRGFGCRTVTDGHTGPFPVNRGTNNLASIQKVFQKL